MIKFDEKTPPADGEYLVFCIAGQWDAQWFDIGEIKGGQWIAESFGKKGFSFHGRVRYYAELIPPKES